MPLTPQQVTRYARHLILDGVGRDGQERLLRATVAVDGSGPAHEEAAVYLAAAGVGRLELHPALAERAGARLKAQNPDCAVERGDGSGAGHLVQLGTAQTRYAGALAALASLTELTGAGGGP